ncbi:hypothetical protein HYY74_02940 [Candidatus Woesearchaeota archaeon]|nr:hypothetical protein [Candidatus Woesearchaeota archaeon]
MDTTIKVRKETKEFLDLIKKHDKQSYDDLIMNLVEDWVEEHLELEPRVRRQILKSVHDIKSGRVKALKFEELYNKVYG